MTVALILPLLALPAARGADGEQPAGAPSTPASPPLSSRLIVEWEPGTTSIDRGAARADADASFVRTLGDARFQLVQPQAGQSTADALASLRDDAAVRSVSRDGYSALHATTNDPLFGQLWGLQNVGLGVDGFAGAFAGADVGATTAWDRTRGSSAIVIADIDSGYRFDAPDLAPVAWTNAADPAGGGDNDGNGIVDDTHGADFVGSNPQAPTTDGDPTDDNLISGGHGVHTAGTMGAAGNNAVGISGVAQNVRIMPLRVCANDPSVNDGRCPFSSQVAAINYAGAHGARAANMSLGGTSFVPSVSAALAANPQTLFVISAGNDAEDNDAQPHYPCAYPLDNVVCVAATDQADQLASFSDWGATSVDLGAPGTETLSTFPATVTPFSDDFETSNFGTKWSTTAGAGAGFSRTNAAPLTSFGMSAVAAAPGTVFSSTSAGVAVPAGAGACRLTQTRQLSVGGGDTFRYFVLKNGVSAFSSGSVTASGRISTTPITGLAGSTVQVRDEFTTGATPTAGHGAWIDDVTLECNAPLSTPPTYAFLEGTSMAAPHVTGAAGLLFSLKPSATVAEVRNALLSSVTPDPALAGKTVTGGRLNVAGAMFALLPPAGPQPPDTAITGGPPGLASVPTSFGFALVGSAAPATFECRLVGESAWSACTSPMTFSAALGLHQLEVRARDGGGAVDPIPAARAWTQVTPPDTAIVSSPAASTTSRSATFAFARADSPEAASFDCRLDGAAFAACSSPATYAVGLGAHVFTVRARDASGGVDATPATYLWTVTAPVVQCKVPKLKGKTLKQATKALKGAHCALGKVTKPKKRKGHPLPPLVVASQKTKAGKLLTAGTKVKLTLGPKPKPKPRKHRAHRR